MTFNAQTHTKDQICHGNSSKNLFSITKSISFQNVETCTGLLTFALYTHAATWDKGHIRLGGGGQRSQRVCVCGVCSTYQSRQVVLSLIYLPSGYVDKRTQTVRSSFAGPGTHHSHVRTHTESRK